MIWLGRKDLLRAGALDWQAALDDVAEAVRLLRRGDAEMVAESVLPLGDDPRAKAYGLPARLGGRFAAAGIKWTVHRPAAPEDGEAITSTTLIEDLATARPLGMVEAALLTRVRTAAVSAHVLRALRPGLRRIALLGAGAQARAHLAMLRALFPDLERIAVWSRLGREVERLGAGITVHPDHEQAIANAEAVLMCSSAPQPFLGPEAATGGRLVLQIGFHEMSFAGIAAFDRVTCDLWGEFARTSAKSLFQMYRAGLFDPAQVAADLPAILCDDWRPAPGESVYFSSFGLNIFDIALAARLLRAASGQGIGTRLPG
ncbi:MULTISPECIES: ornithine cyclodeaminase [Paracoccus]|uniref:Ornithine cyclodeaminase n=1 Tax=Paracoccus versutus TaxID=34007 RepID=A0A3D9XRY8_PARVE|nr:MULTISPECIES: ornithine cyclodeaminase [Paracoccus]REF73165.1 ornithine cyclodeaminase [Paracoccus versutus]WGR54937.1 ornithine cyclodeaminase [Paracoccus versutus]